MLYAHIDRRSGASERKQLLSAHCRGAAETSAKAGLPLGLSHTAYLIGLVHDLGKAKPAFQEYLLETDLKKQRAQRGQINHSAAGARYLWERLRVADASPAALLCAQLTALCIASHHGGFPDCVTPDGVDGFSARLYPAKESNYEQSLPLFLSKCIPEAEIEAHFAPAIQETRDFLSHLRTACGGLWSSAPTFFAGLAARSLFSCILDGDRYDTFCFAADTPPAPPTKAAALWDMLCPRFETALSAMPCTHPVDALRAQIANACLTAAARPPGIYQLYVPTGAGKTLSSLRFALHHARVHGMERILYVIPFTTIIDQNAKIIRDVLSCDDAILEHHASLLPEDDDTERGRRRLLTERWSSPIILTTMVQLLNTLFAGGTQSARRMHSLARAVIIFDEIQAIPVRCIHLFNLAVLFLSRCCGATVVLCTATQPQLDSVPIPLRYACDADLVPDYTDYFAKFRRTEVIDVRRSGAFDTAALAAFVLARNAQSLLSVSNTKRAAQRLYAALCETLAGEPEAVLFFLSTDLCPAHRLQVLGKIRERLACGAGRTLIVSTQLIEAGVDLSVDCVIRSLAGLDNIAQAAGRCNRHGQASRKPVYIIENTDEHIAESLADIAAAQSCCRRVLDEFAADPAVFDHDLLSPAAIERYYRYYFHEQQGIMSYPLDQGGASDLVAMLTQNASGVRELRKHGGTPLPLCQSFEAAGAAFQVIDSRTTAVLVPFDNTAKELLAALDESDDLQEIAKNLRAAQQYAVNLFDNTLSELRRQRALRPLRCGAYALEDGYYDPQTGVTTTRAPLPEYIIQKKGVISWQTQTV